MVRPGAHAEVTALKALVGAIARFTGETGMALSSAEYEIQQTESWLGERRTYWAGEVQRCEQVVAAADATLSACLASGYVDPESGVYYPPNCSAEEVALTRAREESWRVQQELNRVELWIGNVAREAESYRDQAAQVSRLLNTAVPHGEAFLKDKVDLLEEFLSSR